MSTTSTTSTTSTAVLKGKTAVKGSAKVDGEGKVEGVLLAAVKPEVVGRYLAANKLGTDGTLEEQVARLAVFYRSTTPKKDVGDCDVCKGDSNVDEAVCPTCPYCGEGDAVPAETKGPETASVDAMPGKGPPGAKDEESKKLVKVKAKPVAKAIVQEAETAPATVADLDAAIEEVEAAKKGEVGSYWDLGRAIHRIFASKLYLQRRDKDGKPAYETWGSFCAAELGMTGGNSYRVMDVAANYDRETAIRLGVRKLNTLLRVEPAERAKLLVEAERVSADDLEVKVAKVVENAQAGKAADRGRLTPAQTARNKEGTTAKKTKEAAAKAGNVAKPSPAAGAKENLITASLEPRIAVKAFAKGERLADADAKRAKRLADAPFGICETANGIRINVTLTTDAAGALVFVLVSKRLER